MKPSLQRNRFDLFTHILDFSFPIWLTQGLAGGTLLYLGMRKGQEKLAGGKRK
jgi:hypothetical protein